MEEEGLEVAGEESPSDDHNFQEASEIGQDVSNCDNLPLDPGDSFILDKPNDEPPWLLSEELLRCRFLVCIARLI